MARRRRRRGEGTVYKSDGSWIARYPLGTVNGKRITKRVRCKTEREALQELERMRRAYSAGMDPATGTLGAYLEDWVRTWRRVRESTRISYEGHIRLHIGPLLGGIPLSRLRPADVRRLVAELERKGLSAGSIHRVITTLRIALNAAVRDRSIADNPAAGVPLPAVEHEPPRPLSHADADAIYEATKDTWLGPVVRLLLGSGLRLGEAVGLNQGDVDLERGFVRLRTSKTTLRAVPVTDDAVDALRAAIASAPRRGAREPVFFGTRKRDRLRGDSVTHALPRILESAGIGHLTPHALRHGAATLMVADGIHIKYVAEQLGHKNPALTAKVYAHVLPEGQRAALASLERRRAR